VTGSVVGKDNPTQIPIGTPIALIGPSTGAILPFACLTGTC
jgi:hypothetical protein